jgi:phosphatidate cytidylyltransferase
LRLNPATTHVQRIITAAVIIPVFFVILFWGGPVLFIFLVWAGFSVGNRELLHLLFERPSGYDLWFFWLIGTLTIGGTYFFRMEGLLMALFLGILLSFVRWIFCFPNQSRFYELIGKQFFALWYLPFLLPFFLLIRMDPQGLKWFFFLLAVIYAGDTGAFYVGRTLGRHKLAPMVSPQKTIEGSLGGLAANFIAAWIFQATLFSLFSWLPMIIIGVTIGIVSQVGDLLESMIKRTARVKDSGSIFPGHGGLLDRIDSIVLPAPVVYFFMRFLVGGL